MKERNGSYITENGPVYAPLKPPTVGQLEQREAYRERFERKFGERKKGKRHARM